MPRSSSSVTVAVTVYSTVTAKPLPLATSVIEASRLSSALSTLSSTPVTVTVCAWFQSPGLKVSSVWSRVRAPVSPVMVRATVTSPVGWESSATVKLSVPAFSATVTEFLDRTRLRPPAVTCTAAVSVLPSSSVARTVAL